MTTPPAAYRRVSPLLLFAILCLLAAVLAAAMTSCGNSFVPPPGALGTAGPTTSTTLGLSGATVTETSSVAPGGGTGTSTAPYTSGTSVPNGPTTTVLPGTTVSGGGSRSLTYVGPVTAELRQSLRNTVIDAGGDGQKVLDGIAKLSAGPAVDVATVELDALSGIGFSAGATATQSIAVATEAGGAQILIFAFTVMDKPKSTTIVGFDRRTKHVAFVEGPLPVSDSTKNITTIPGQ